MDNEVFNGKTLKDLFKDIYTNSTKKSKTINDLITTLQPLVKDIKDATLVVPLIKEYLEIDVRNDEILVKLAVVAQRDLAKKDSGLLDDNFGLSKDEFEKIRSEVEKLQESNNNDDVIPPIDNQIKEKYQIKSITSGSLIE